MGIITKLNASFDATKQFTEAWAVFGICLAAAGIYALIGLTIWVANYMGSAPACFALSGLFLVASGISKFIIDAKGREAQKNLSSAKSEAVQDISAITNPINIANKVATGHVSSVLPVAIFASMICVAYLVKDKPLD